MRDTTQREKWAQQVFLLACLGVWGLCVPAAAYGQSDTPDATDTPAPPPERAPVTMGAEPGYPPYSFVDDTGNATGFSVELFRAVAEAMNLDLRIEVAPWNTIKGQLAAGELDALPLVGRTPEREELFDFTVPYLSLYGGIVVREDVSDITRFQDLAGHRVAVMNGDNAEEFRGCGQKLGLF
ncbi:MAG: transporter substrate-binding domain-containing protein [Spirochaeta sp.]|jgi:ABC-type amino acid transport substrate-binding protein|nr:transporter substrate-binding domain-containing protein [Spirochaeta sp.]